MGFYCFCTETHVLCVCVCVCVCVCEYLLSDTINRYVKEVLLAGGNCVLLIWLWKPYLRLALGLPGKQSKHFPSPVAGLGVVIQPRSLCPVALPCHYLPLQAWSEGGLSDSPRKWGAEMGLPDLASKNTGHPVKSEFQVNMEWFFTLSPVLYFICNLRHVPSLLGPPHPNTHTCLRSLSYSPSSAGSIWWVVEEQGCFQGSPQGPPPLLPMRLLSKCSLPGSWHPPLLWSREN